MDVPWRRDFDAARDPYTARVALGLTAAATGGPFQPLDGDLTALAALTGVNVIYYRSAADMWSPVIIGAGLSFDTGGTLTATGGTSGAAEYSFSTNTGAPPSSGQVRFNNATYSAVTIVWFHNLTAGATDIKRGLLATPVGTRMIIQDQGDSSKYAEYTLASAPIDSGTYVDFPVTFLAAGAAISNNQRVLFVRQSSSAYQPLDADLSSIASYGGTGAWLYRSAADTWSAVTIGTGLSFSAGTLSAPKTGVTDGSNAAAGNIGEYMSATSGSTAVTSGGWAALTSITLTAGDWDVSGWVQFSHTAGSVVIHDIGGIGLSPAAGSPSGQYQWVMGHTSWAVEITAVIPQFRINLTSTTTYYIMGLAAQASGNAIGIIRARRVR